MKTIHNGFTFVEVIVSLVLLGLLASIVIPVSDIVTRKSKERELKQALYEIRSAIDNYKEANDNNEIPEELKTKSGYPPSLMALTGGTVQSNDGKIHRFIRRIPADPFSTKKEVLPADTWGKRSFLSEADKPLEGEDIYDIYSLSEQKGSNGITYNEW